MAGEKRRSALDRLLELPPLYPQLPPDIDIGPHGRASVDTSNGVDKVYLLTSHPLSFNEPLSDTCTDNERIDDYIHGFLADRAKHQPKVEAKTGDVQRKSNNNGDIFEPPNSIFCCQAKTWRAVLKRRERAALDHSQKMLLTGERIDVKAWKKHLLSNATIRKIIYSLEGKQTSPVTLSSRFGSHADYLMPAAASLFILRDSRYTDPSRPHISCAHPGCPLPLGSITAAGTAYLSLESVNAPDRRHPSDGGLQTSPGIQVADDVFIPVFIRPIRATPPPLSTSPAHRNHTVDNSGASLPVAAYRPDYSAPAPASAKHQPCHRAPLQDEDKDESDNDDDNNDKAEAITVHASLCIPCLRDLYAGPIAPDTADASTQSHNAANPSSARPSKPRESCSEKPKTSMIAVATTSGSGGGSDRAADAPNSNDAVATVKATPIPQLDGVSDSQGDNGGNVSSAGFGCIVM